MFIKIYLAVVVHVAVAHQEACLLSVAIVERVEV